MDTRPITPARLAGSVIAVPPLARNASHSVDTEQNRKLVQYIEQGGVSTLLYGGNAIFYHLRLSEYARILQMLTDVVASSTLVVPAVGPAFGTMMDQAEILQDFDFPTVMLLPQTEVTDSAGIASGVRKFAEAFGKPVVLYLKHDQWLPAETVGKMFRSGLLSWIKYAVVRKDPREDEYLREVLAEVPGEIVVSGIGEQPAIVHMQDFHVGSFTSGCVCVNPSRSMKMLRAIQAEQLDTAQEIRASFEGLEDLRNRINPIRVLHRAVELAEIAETGPITPMLGELSASEVTSIANAALSLKQL